MYIHSYYPKYDKIVPACVWQSRYSLHVHVCVCVYTCELIITVRDLTCVSVAVFSFFIIIYCVIIMTTERSLFVVSTLCIHSFVSVFTCIIIVL